MRVKTLIQFFEDRRKIYELSIGLALLVILSFFVLSRFLDPFEMLFFDLHFKIRGARAFPQEIMVAGVDEASLDAFGRWPWSRDKHAKLMDLLNHQSFRPKSIAFDMLFEDRDTHSPRGDEDLIYRAKEFKGKIFMAYFFEKSPNPVYAERYERHPEKEKRLEEFALPPSSNLPEHLEEYEKVSLPFLELAQRSELAFVNTPADDDGRTRRAQLLAKYRGNIYPSEDLLIALDYWGASVKDVTVDKRAIRIKTLHHGERVIPVNSKGELLINYYASSEDLPAVSYLGILDAGKGWMQGKKPELLINLKDKILLVGVTALGIGDRRTTPFYRYEPGVNLHAQVIANIVENVFLMRLSPGYSLAALWALGLAVIYATMLLKIHRCLPMILFLMGSYFLFTHILFLQGKWLDFAVQALSLVIIFIGITSFRYFTALEELKRTQEQLIQSAKMASLGELSSGIAHEFRNILNAVNLNVECVLRPDLPPERVQKYSEMLRRIMKSSNEILEGLLMFSRQSQSAKTPGNLKIAVQDTLLILEKELMRHQIHLETDLKDLPDVAFDRGQVSQVLMNMVNNSRDALKDRPNKQIKISLNEENAMIRLDIADNGSGIPPQVLKRLFQPFVTSKPPGKGTGLGLSVCHGIIKNHGGDIKVTTAQDKGTTWHIYLPKR